MKFKPVWFLLGLVFFAQQGRAQSTFSKVQKKQEQLKAGQTAYENRCSGCHGLTGEGNGPAAKMLNPKPRDFTKGIFKFKTTALGKVPTDADLMQVINQGVVGTSMPSFLLVSEAEKLALVEYIKSFAKESFKAQNGADVVPALKMPDKVFTLKAEFMKAAERGRVWFNELGCITCHGSNGQGNGASSATLQDVWKEKILPANLTKPYIKRGYRVQDIAYTIANGVDGTPMPAHADILSALEPQFPELKDKGYVWDLTAFIFYLRGQAMGLYAQEIAPIPENGLSRDEVLNSPLAPYFQ